MAEFIGNAFEWFMTTVCNSTTAIIHAGEALLGAGGAILALILISSVIYNRK